MVRAAGALAARMLAEGLETQHKTSVSDVVSAADFAAEKLIVDRLADERPGDGLVGEEGARRSGDRTWYIDPVDGTYNFLSGIPVWCSALGLVDGEGPVLGAVYHPSMDELWLGGRDLPTTCNGQPVPQLDPRPLAELSLASYLHPARMGRDELRQPWLSALSGAATMRSLGSGSVELASVAAGRLGAFLQAGPSPWDWFPGVALVRAAGGVAEVIEHRGQSWHVAGNPQAVEDIRSALLSGCCDRPPGPRQ
nr:inositol monophosphatase family protein [Microlunatus panaciterrae]